MTLAKIKSYLYTDDDNSIFKTYHSKKAIHPKKCEMIWTAFPDRNYSGYIDTKFNGDKAHRNKKITSSDFLFAHFGNMVELYGLDNAKTLSALFNQTNIGGSVSIRESISKNDSFRERIYNNACIGNIYLIKSYCINKESINKLSNALYELIQQLDTQEYSAALMETYGNLQLSDNHYTQYLNYNIQILGTLLTWLLFIGLLGSQFKCVFSYMNEDLSRICEDDIFYVNDLPDDTHDTANRPSFLFILDSLSQNRKKQLTEGITKIGNLQKVSVKSCVTSEDLEKEWKRISDRKSCGYNLVVCLFGNSNSASDQSYEIIRQFIYYFRENNIPVFIFMPQEPITQNKKRYPGTDVKLDDMAIFSEPMCNNEYFFHEKYVFNPNYLYIKFANLIADFSEKGHKYRSTRDSDNVARTSDPEELISQIKAHTPTVAKNAFTQMFNRTYPETVWQAILDKLCKQPYCLKEVLIFLNNYHRYEHFVFNKGIEKFAELEPNEFPLVLSAVRSNSIEQFDKLDALHLADEHNINMINLRKKIARQS